MGRNALGAVDSLSCPRENWFATAAETDAESANGGSIRRRGLQCALIVGICARFATRHSTCHRERRRASIVDANKFWVRIPEDLIMDVTNSEGWDSLVSLVSLVLFEIG